MSAFYVFSIQSYWSCPPYPACFLVRLLRHVPNARPEIALCLIYFANRICCVRLIRHVRLVSLVCKVPNVHMSTSLCPFSSSCISVLTYIIFDPHEPGDRDEDFSKDKLEGQVIGSDHGSEPLKDAVDEGHKG